MWLLNALHGIRLVTGLIGAGIAPGDGGHFASWRERVERLRTPLNPPSAIGPRQLEVVCG